MNPGMRVITWPERPARVRFFGGVECDLPLRGIYAEQFWKGHFKPVDRESAVLLKDAGYQQAAKV